MARDALGALLQVRRIALDEARRLLAARLADEGLARDRTDAAEALIGREGEMASDLMLGDKAVEMYAAWLPQARKAAQAARAASDKASENVNLARVSLTLANAALQAASDLVARRSAAIVVTREQKIQQTLDELAVRNSGNFCKPTE